MPTVSYIILLSLVARSSEDAHRLALPALLQVIHHAEHDPDSDSDRCCEPPPILWPPPARAGEGHREEPARPENPERGGAPRPDGGVLFDVDGLHVSARLPDVLTSQVGLVALLETVVHIIGLLVAVVVTIVALVASAVTGPATSSDTSETRIEHATTGP